MAKKEEKREFRGVLGDQQENSEEIETAYCSLLEDEMVVARKRWKLVAKAILQRNNRYCNSSDSESEVSVRRFKTFNLISYSSDKTRARDEEKYWTYCAFPYTDFKDLKILIKIPEDRVSVEDIIGFNNTGNVCIWPAEEVMAHYCLRNSEKFNGKVVLELGAGMTGIAGFVVAFCCQSKQVIITDGNDKSCDSLTEILERNCEVFPNLRLQSKVRVQRLRWGEWSECEELLGKVDVILAADCLFFDDSREALLHTLSRLLSSKGKALLFAPSRSGTFDNFLEMAKKSKFFEKADFKFDYDGIVTEKYRTLSSNGDKKVYDQNLHYPLMLSVEM